MRKRLAWALAAGLLAAALLPGVASAGQTSIGGGDGEVGAGFRDFGAGWLSFFACDTGADVIGRRRFALEFPLTSLPAGAAIVEASLALQTHDHVSAGRTAIRGYAGNGTIVAADVEVAGSDVFFTPTTSTARTEVDVTTLLTPGVVAAGWAGFSIRQEPLGTIAVTWDCPGGSLFPILTIEYADEPATKGECKKGGWRDLTRADGSSFRNQGACVRYVARMQG